MLIAIFVKLEKKEKMDQASGIKKIPEGFIVELVDYIGEGIIALVLAFFIYLPKWDLF